MRRISLLLSLTLLLSACGVAAVDTSLPPPANGVEAFNRLRDQIAATDDVERQRALVAEFFAQYPQMPLVADETAVFMVERPDTSSVLLTGDMTNWLQTIPMERLGQTDAWALVQTFPADARLDYRFGVGGSGRDIFNDPRNPNLSPTGFFGGNNTELRMPAYIPPQEVVERPDTPRGTLENLGLYKSTLSNTTHELVVYTPPGYDPALRYPSVYFQDGDDYRDYADTPTILDNAISDGILPPLIAVFVTPSEENGRQEDYNLNDAYADFFATELVELIDSRYATVNDDPAQRIVVGDSFGGLISLYIALRSPDVFGGVLNQSGFVSRYNGRLITLFALQAPPNIRIDTVVGTFETCVGGPVTGEDCDFLEGNRALRDVLDARGYTHRYNEYPQGHAWGFWRDYLDENIAWLLDWQRPR